MEYIVIKKVTVIETQIYEFTADNESDAISLTTYRNPVATDVTRTPEFIVAEKNPSIMIEQKRDILENTTHHSKPIHRPLRRR
jgi:hypothetical protein